MTQYATDILTRAKIPDEPGLGKLMQLGFVLSLKESVITQCKEKLHPEGRAVAKRSTAKDSSLLAWYHL